MIRAIQRRARGWWVKLRVPFKSSRIGLSTVLHMDPGAVLICGRSSVVRERGNILIERGGTIAVGDHTAIMQNAEIVVEEDARLAIGSSVYVGASCNLRCGSSITIGDGVRLAQFVSLVDSNYEFKRRDAPIGNSVPGFIVIGAGAWLGAQVVVLPNVTIGEGAVVGAGSIVTRDVAPYTIVVGNPAHVVGVRE
jgi:acetyltransferase-like isoleucine patch superfamily enzyme